MDYMFDTAKEGDEFFLSFVTAQGKVRKMHCRIPHDFNHKAVHHCKKALVLDVDLGEFRYVNTQTILSIVKIVKSYTWKKVDKFFHVYKNGALIGKAYSEEQAKKLIDFHKTWKKRS